MTPKRPHIALDIDGVLADFTGGFLPHLSRALGREVREEHITTYSFEEALRIRPDYAEAHNGLGSALDEQGKFAEAIAHFASDAASTTTGAPWAAAAAQRACARSRRSTV